MRSGTATGSRATAAEPSSPELALVDRELAARARERLPATEDTIERLERAIAMRRLTALTTLADPVDHAEPQRSARRQTSRPRATRRTVAAAVAATLLIALLLGVEVDLRGNPAGADPYAETGVEQPAPAAVPAHASERPPSSPTTSAERRSTPAGTPKPGRDANLTSGQGGTTRTSSLGYAGNRTLEPAPRRFAWAPVPGATAYHVEFFRDSTRVYATRTRDPQLDLPRSWLFRGRSQRLTPGTYRWYVWPIRSGRRGQAATVQAELVVD